MADNVDIRVRVQGARKAAAEAKTVGRSVGNIGDKSAHTARQTDRLSKSQGRGRRSMVALGTAAKYGGLALGAGLFVGLKKSISAFEESRQVTAQTGAVLKSTGGVANVTGRDVDKLTASLMRKTAIDDEQIRTGANMLLTFTRIRNEAGKNNKIFDRTTVAATDMAAALGTDAKGSALMLGKALNDPAAGLGKLMRVGVTFSQSQQDQIKKLQESGDMLGAQKVILREVTKEFGGSAAAQKTPLKALSVSFGELAETVGAGVAPAVDKGAKKLSRFVTQMQTGKGAGGRFVVTLRELWTEAKPIVTWLGRAAVNVGKFVGKHPEIAKVAVALAAVGLAVKALKFGRALSGVDSLIGGLRRVGQTKAGQRAAEAITGQLSGPGVREKFRKSGRGIGTTIGTSASTTAANAIAGQGTAGAAAGGGLAAKTKAKVGSRGFKTKMRGAGKLAGGAIALGMLVAFQDDLEKGFKNLSGGWFDKLLLPFSPRGYESPVKPYRPPRGAPPFKPDDGPLRIVPRNQWPGSAHTPGHPTRPGGRGAAAAAAVRPVQLAAMPAFAGGGVVIENHNNTYLDGKPIHRSVTRQEAKLKARG